MPQTDQDLPHGSKSQASSKRKPPILLPGEPCSHSEQLNEPSSPRRAYAVLTSEPHSIPARHLPTNHPLQFLTDEPSLALLSDELHLILRSRANHTQYRIQHHTQYSIQYPLSIEPTPSTANESNRYSSREAPVAPDEPNHLTPTDPLSREPALLLRTSRILHPLLRATPTATEPDRVHIPLAMIAHA
jgi:hypothetical protein